MNKLEECAMPKLPRYDYYFYVASKSEPGCWDVIGVDGGEGHVLCGVTSEGIAKNLIKEIQGRHEKA